MSDIDIRAAASGDEIGLDALYSAAFPDEDLRPLVSQLLRSEPSVFSLVAVNQKSLIGHIAFSACEVGEVSDEVYLLGPLAVTPLHARQGVGGSLISAGLETVRQRGGRVVLVLGDPNYYARFGFTPERHITTPYELPAEWADAWRSVYIQQGSGSIAGPLRPPSPWLVPALWR